MMVRVGNPAPDFAVGAYVRGLSKPRTISLSALRGRWVVLFFYPHDFTYHCPTELRAFARLRREFAHEQAVVLGASSGSYYSHRAWFEGDSRLGAANFPVIADTDQRLSAIFRVARAGGEIVPGTFLIDPAGIVRHMHVNEVDAGNTAEETLSMLRALRAGERRPIDEPTVPNVQTPGSSAIATR